MSYDSQEASNGEMNDHSGASFTRHQEEQPVQDQLQQESQWTNDIAGNMLPVPTITEPTYHTQQPSRPGAASENFADVDATKNQGQWSNMGSHEQAESGHVQGGDDMLIRHWNDSFMEMDRVITFTDGGLFSAELENAIWQP